MSNKNPTISARKLAAIMFTDIAGYTALMGEDEDRAFQLLKKNRQIQRPIIEKYGGKWLKEIGDGVLASFNTVSDAVYCAGAIQKACDNEPELNLRIGIHQGEVVFEGEDVFGDGVNIASRLEPLAPIGGIVVSDSVHRNIQNKKGIVSEFIREETLKNVKHPVRIYEVEVNSEEAISPVEKLTRTQSGLLSKKYVKGMIVIGGFIIAIAFAYFLYTLQAKKGDETLVAARDVENNSIAVLPFRNDSPDKENEYFCNGMMEEILDKLAKIKDLKVPSRTAMESYRNTTKDPREIGNELNVANVLEGSVRKSGNSFRISVQLISAVDGYHIWSETYSGTFSDSIFIVQSNIAKNIANSLNAMITPEEENQISMIPTRNIDAYDLYMQGLEMNSMYWKTQDKNYLTKAWNLYQKVYKIDPNYAEAYHGMGTVFFAWKQYDSALYYAHKAVFLKENFGRAYGLLGETYLSLQNPKSAIQNLENAIKLESSPYWYYIVLGKAYNRIGDYKKGMRYLSEGLNNINIQGRNSAYTQIGMEFYNIGIYEKANKYLKKALEFETNCFTAVFYGWSLNMVEEYNEALTFADSLESSSSCIEAVNSIRFWNYFLSNEEDRALDFAKICLENENYNFLVKSSYYYLLLMAGNKHSKDSLIQIVGNTEKINQKTFFNKFDLVRIYSSLNQKQKSLDNLRILFEKSGDFEWLGFISLDPMFDNIRSEDVYIDIIKKASEKRDANREIVQKMEENGEIDL